jgi:hypothetical protein
LEHGSCATLGSIGTSLLFGVKHSVLSNMEGEYSVVDISATMGTFSILDAGSM